MLGIDSPDTGRIASFPLLDPGRAPTCSTDSISPASPVAARSAPATSGSTRNLTDLENDIEPGKQVSFPIKYISAVYGYVYMADGVVTLSKTTFTFRGTVGAQDCQVAPGKVLDLANEPEQASRLRVKIAVLNKKGTKEDKKDYYFYSAGASAVGGGPGGQGASISCSGCDDSMNLLYALLTKFR